MSDSKDIEMNETPRYFSSESGTELMCKLLNYNVVWKGQEMEMINYLGMRVGRRAVF